MNIGDRIRERRKEEGLTQKGLAEISGVSEMAIRKYESSDRQPRLEQLQKIAKALETTVDSLLYGEITTRTVNYYDEETGEAGTAAMTVYPKGHPFHIPTLQEAETQENVLLAHFNKLNDSGRDRAVTVVGELSEIPRYQRKPQQEE